MSMRVILCVPGSEAEQWRHAAQGAFDVVKATTWAEAMTKEPIDAGFVFFHLAERLGLSAADGRSVVHENPSSTGPRYLLTSPRLPAALTRDSEATIARFVLEAMAAAAYDDGHEPRIRAVGFMSMDLGGHSDLSVSARARAVINAILEYRAIGPCS
jgi:hypothetical protein